MKYLLTILFILLINIVYSQDQEEIQQDTVPIINIGPLNSDTLRMLTRNKNIDIGNFCIYSRNYKEYIAYRKNKKNPWFTFSFDFGDNPSSTRSGIDSIQEIRGSLLKSHALVIYLNISSYGVAMGSGDHYLSIVTMDSIPKQIFYIDYGCWTEDLGKFGEDYYMADFRRDLKVLKNGIEISPLPFIPTQDDCKLTDIPSGTYKLKHGQMVKSKHKKSATQN